jgi:hypothetical protein
VAFHATRVLGQLRVQPARQLQHLTRVARQRLPGGRGLDALRGTVQQRHAIARLEDRDASARRRERDVRLLRGLGETAGIDRADEYQQGDEIG